MAHRHSKPPNCLSNRVHNDTNTVDPTCWIAGRQKVEIWPWEKLLQADQKNLQLASSLTRCSPGFRIGLWVWASPFLAPARD